MLSPGSAGSEGEEFEVQQQPFRTEMSGVTQAFGPIFFLRPQKRNREEKQRQLRNTVSEHS